MTIFDKGPTQSQKLLLSCTVVGSCNFPELLDERTKNTSEQTFIPYNCVQVELSFMSRIVIFGKQPNALKDGYQLCICPCTLRITKISPQLHEFVVSRWEENIYRLSRRVPRNSVVSCGTKAIRERKVAKDTCDISQPPTTILPSCSSTSLKIYAI